MIWTVVSERGAIMFDNEYEYDYADRDDYDDRMDGDFDSGMASAGFGTDEDYGCYSSDD